MRKKQLITELFGLDDAAAAALVAGAIKIAAIAWCSIVAWLSAHAIHSKVKKDAKNDQTEYDLNQSDPDTGDPGDDWETYNKNKNNNN